MKKSLRHKKIIELVSHYEIDTQEELVERLKASDCDITQATVSRDTKELGLIKVAGVTKRFKYAYTKNSPQDVSGQIGILKSCLKSIDYSQNIIVGKTIVGFASTACALIEGMNLPDILGTIGGDDTFLIIVKPHAVQNIHSILQDYIND